MTAEPERGLPDWKPQGTIASVMACVDEQDGIYEILNTEGERAFVRWNPDTAEWDEVAEADVL